MPLALVSGNAAASRRLSPSSSSSVHCTDSARVASQVGPGSGGLRSPGVPTRRPILARSAALGTIMMLPVSWHAANASPSLKAGSGPGRARAPAKFKNFPTRSYCWQAPRPAASVKVPSRAAVLVSLTESEATALSGCHWHWQSQCLPMMAVLSRPVLRVRRRVAGSQCPPAGHSLRLLPVEARRRTQLQCHAASLLTPEGSLAGCQCSLSLRAQANPQACCPTDSEGSPSRETRNHPRYQPEVRARSHGPLATAIMTSELDTNGHTTSSHEL